MNNGYKFYKTPHHMPAKEFQDRYNLELAPCPFCKSVHLYVYFSNAPHVECASCGAEGPHEIGRTSEIPDNAHQAGMKWNLR
jgi:hypothetical protein